MSKIPLPPVEQAYEYSRAADTYADRGQWMASADAHYRAAELFLTAIERLSDPESIRALKLLHQNHLIKGKECKKYAASGKTSESGANSSDRGRNRPPDSLSSHPSRSRINLDNYRTNVNSVVNELGDMPGTLPRTSSEELLTSTMANFHYPAGKGNGNEIASTPQSSASIGSGSGSGTGSGAGSTSYLAMKRPTAYHEEWERPLSPELPWYQYISDSLEKMLGIVQKGAGTLVELSKGVLHGSSPNPNSNTVDQSTSALFAPPGSRGPTAMGESFYMVPAEQGKMNINDARAISSMDPQQLRGALMRLMQENEMLRHAYKDALARTQRDQDVLKSSLLMIRSEVHKRIKEDKQRMAMSYADRDRDRSGAGGLVGGVNQKLIHGHGHGLQAPTQSSVSNRNRVAELTAALEAANAHIREQERQIQRHEERWNELKEKAHTHSQSHRRRSSRMGSDGSSGGSVERERERSKGKAVLFTRDPSDAGAFADAPQSSSTGASHSDVGSGNVNMSVSKPDDAELSGLGVSLRLTKPGEGEASSASASSSSLKMKRSTAATSGVQESPTPTPTDSPSLYFSAAQETLLASLRDPDSDSRE